MAAAMKKREGPKAPPTPDYQEEQALARAVAAAQRFAPTTSEGAVSVAISEWIIARTSMAASVRLNADLMFDLKDARLRGFVEAALPAIGGSLEHLPADKPLFDLSKEEVVSVFIAGIRGAQEAAVSANESLGFPFSDEVPF
jgi:hypothetical protein